MAEKGRRGGGGKPPNGGESSRTQRVPMLVELSSSLEVSLVEPDLADATQPTMSRPPIAPDSGTTAPVVIVMEERPVGLADALARLGIPVRKTSTGMESLALCAERPPPAVVIGPGDVERRRVLVGALRARYPAVAIVYVLPAPDQAMREGAKAEGVRAVLSWPLPPPPLVHNAIPHRASPIASPVPAVTRVALTAAMPAVSSVPELSADLSETGSVPRPRPSSLSAIPLPAPPRPMPTASPPPEQTLSVARGTPQAGIDLATVQVERLDLPATRDSAAERTSQTRRPTSIADGEVASNTHDLPQAASILWQLDDAARFLEDLAAHHVRGADQHAVSVRRAAELLAKRRG